MRNETEIALRKLARSLAFAMLGIFGLAALLLAIYLIGTDAALQRIVLAAIIVIGIAAVSLFVIWGSGRGNKRRIRELEKSCDTSQKQKATGSSAAENADEGEA